MDMHGRPRYQADRENFAQRVAGGIISLMGIVFFAIVLAFTVDIVREKLERLKRGTGGVVEEGHTLILGYSDKALLVARYARTLVDFSMISVSFPCSMIRFCVFLVFLLLLCTGRLL